MQLTDYQINYLPLVGSEPRISGVWSRSLPTAPQPLPKDSWDYNHPFTDPFVFKGPILIFSPSSSTSPSRYLTRTRRPTGGCPSGLRLLIFLQKYLCLICTDCEKIFLTCPNNTLFFFAFQACRCPTPSPSLRSSTGRSGWFARLKRTSWPSRGWRSTQTSWTWWSRSASSVTTTPSSSLRPRRHDKIRII